MTLILAIETPHYVIQAGDRLVTIHGSGEIHDRTANKALVIRARNGLAALSYSGTAYVERQPTDQWIARVITGVAEEFRGIRLGKTNIGTRTIDQVLHSLKLALDARSEPKHGLAVQTVGWKIVNRRRLSPFSHTMTWGQQSNASQTLKPWWRRPRKELVPLNAIGGAEAAGLTLLNSKIGAYRQARGAFPPAEDAEKIIVEVIREISSFDKTVGPNVLTIALPNPSMPDGRNKVQFFPADEHNGVISSETGPMPNIVIPVAHSPWLTSRRIIYQPSSIVGKWTHDLSGVEIDLIGASPLRGVLAASSSINRRPPPI